MQGLFDQFRTISDENLTLRKVNPEDAQDLTDLYDFPMKMKTAEKMIRDYEVCYAEKKEILIGFAYNGQIYGVLELYHFDGDTCELGYRTCIHGRGRGITRKAVGLLLKSLENTELHKLYACCEQNHRASRCILEDNGFRLMKTEDRKYWYQKDLTETLQ